MVTTASAYDFAAIVDTFLAQKKLSGRHARQIGGVVRARALALLENPDVRYMPTFKVLDLLAAVSNIAAALDEATQLRPTEIEILLREALSDSSPLARQFLLDAALERARYEPLMLHDSPENNSSNTRDAILQRRWASMRAAHQERAKLPESWIITVDHAVEAVLTAEEFRLFRQGPLLQLFAEMLELARSYFQRHESPATLSCALSEEGKLWRRYALKAARYQQKPEVPTSLLAMKPASPHLH